VAERLTRFQSELEAIKSPGDHTEQWLTVQKLLLDEFMDLESPQITRKMFSYLTTTEAIHLFTGVLTQRQGGATSVQVVEKIHSGDMEAGQVISFKWRREPNVYPQGEEAYIHRSFDMDRDDPEVETRLRRSYALMSLLCGLTQAEDSDGLGSESFHVAQKQICAPSRDCLEFTRVSMPALVAYLLDAFHPESQASLYHVCKVLDVLLRYHPSDMLSALLSNRKAFKTALTDMLQYIHYPCVSDLFLSLAVPIPRNVSDLKQRFYLPSNAVLEEFFKAMSSCNVLLMVASHIWAPHAPEQHKSAAAELLGTLVQRYSGLEGCSDILTALVRSPELLQGLIAAACGESESNEDEDPWLVGPSSKKKPGKSSSSSKKKKGSKKKLKRQKSSKSAAVSKKEKVEPEAEETSAGQQVDEIVPETYPEDEAQHSKDCDAALDALRKIIELSTSKQIRPSMPQEYTSFADSVSRMMDCQLAPVSDRLHVILESCFDKLFKAVVDSSSSPPTQTEGSDVKHSIYVVRKPFSSYRLELIKLIVACVTHKPKVLLGKITPENWTRLTNWFLEYPHCNLYHVAYRALFDALLRNDDSSYKKTSLVLGQCRLLDSMIEAFSNKSRRERESLSGPILMLCNSLRLYLQAIPPHHPLALFLAEHEGWQNFQPLLLQETLKLVEPWPESGGEVVQESQKFGIDLGSGFANELGFTGVQAYKPKH